MLVADRYCPRCDERTSWTNEHDQGPAVACAGCGLTAAGELTPEEHDRLVAFDAKPVVRHRRPYVRC